jgi:hypothetical protein
MAYKPRLLRDKPSTAKDGKVRNAANVVTSRELRVLFCVHFQDKGTTCHMGCGACDLGSRHFAGTAPVCPEVYENRYTSVLHDLIEELSVDRKRLVYGSKIVFAGTTTTGVGEMVGGDTVFLTTVWTASDKRHEVQAPDLIGCLRDYAGYRGA